MSESQWVHVVKSGVVTPIGDSASMTAVAISAGICTVEETGFLNKYYQPIKMGVVPEELLPDVCEPLKSKNLPDRQLRLLRLASAALQQLDEDLPVDNPLTLILALPELLPEKSKAIKGNFVEQLVEQSDIPLNVAESQIACIGRAGGLHAIEVAHRYLESTGKEYVLVGGVDTYWDSHLLARLDEEDRLNVPGSFDGFFPGEGASFLLLCSSKEVPAISDNLIKLYRPGLSKEPGHRYSDVAYLGEGLSEAAKSAVANAGDKEIESLWTSMIYDGFGNKELGVMMGRATKSFVESPSMNHPVDCFGDLGAAIGPVLISVIAASVDSGGKESEFLVTCSSDLEYRAALRISFTL